MVITMLNVYIRPRKRHVELHKFLGSSGRLQKNDEHSNSLMIDLPWPYEREMHLDSCLVARSSMGLVVIGDEEFNKSPMRFRIVKTRAFLVK